MEICTLCGVEIYDLDDIYRNGFGDVICHNCEVESILDDEYGYQFEDEEE